MRLFIVEKVIQLDFYQEYKLLRYKENRERREELIEELNEFLSRNEDISLQAKFLEAHNKKLEKVSNEFEEFGKIKCLLKENVITIDIESDLIDKRFQYNEGEYLDDVMKFLDNEFNELVNKKIIEED